MKPADLDYYDPSGVEEALDLLSKHRADGTSFHARGAVDAFGP